MGNAGRIKVFYSYAQEDDELRKQLEKHLVVMARMGEIEGWHPRCVGAGGNWRGAVDEHLAAADVVLLLVSADFLASDYCWDVEMTRALDRHEAGEALVIPVLLRPCDWRRTRFAKLRPLPAGEKPVTKWEDEDDAWLDVVEGIRAALATRRGPAAPPPARAPSAPLVAARARKARLVRLGQSTAEIDQEILTLRRALRAGGQLHEGDALGDGRYVLVRRLGKGGFAVVWEAHDQVSSRRVAIKVLHPDLTREASRVERFFRGARAMAELGHEGVVRVLDRHGEEDGWHYFVMEFVPGGDFRQAVLGKTLGTAEVVAIVCRVGEVLAAGHAKGLIHRDVKPANILLDAAGAPRLTDFDLVAAADTTGGTRTGAMGTFLYAAPELMDRPQEADARADVYGLAMTAIFGLYGSELPMTMMRHGDRVIAGLSCNAKAKAALKKAVAWEKDERFESMATFCEALLSALPSLAMRTAAECREAVSRWTVSSRCNAVAWSPTGERVAIGREAGSVRLRDAMSGMKLREFRSHTRSIEGVAFSPNGRVLASGSHDKKVILWDVSEGHVLHALEGHKKWVNSVAFSLDGKTLASASDDNTVILWDVSKGCALRTLEGHKNGVTSVAFGRDGKTFASGSYDSTVVLWDVSKGRALRTLEGHKSGVTSVAFSPNGTIFASGSSERMVVLWDVSNGHLVRTLEGHKLGVTSIAFSQDGKTLASGSYDTTVALWEVSRGRLLHTLEGHKDRVTSVAFSPGGQTLATASYDGTIRLWDVATARCLAILLDTPYGWAAFTPDGRYKVGGYVADNFWHVFGGRRLEPGELDAVLPGLRLPDDANFLTLPPPSLDKPRPGGK